MKELRITLIGDGSSDKTLQEVVKWLVNDLFPEQVFKIQFADFRYLPEPPLKSEPKNQIQKAKELYPYELLIYHRDAETNNIDAVNKRKTEIFSEIGEENKDTVVCVVPVRMMETWLMIDHNAIKKAAGNRNYQGAINLPNVARLEKEIAPKEKLHSLLKEASNLKGRRLAKFNVHQSVHLVAEYIEDYSPLRLLKAFQIFEKDLKDAMENLLSS
ncbi:MAG: DUF4276 family protein [Paludibacteraceae bacterium]|nr:DUF4276 family protein [Paludibacteraceae bacterium]